MHLYGFLVPPWSSLIIFVSFGWSFLASCNLCQSWQKGEKLCRICSFFFFFFKILHVRGRNTFLCKGEMCFILLRGVLTSLFLYTGLMTMFIYIVLIFDDICLLQLLLHILFLFYLYAHASYILYAIYYFCLTLRYLDEFCLKCFRNTGCQSLLAMNSLLTKFFKSLC